MEDVVNNFRQFLLSIKRATGNSRDAENTSGARPGMFHPVISFSRFSYLSKCQLPELCSVQPKGLEYGYPISEFMYFTTPIFFKMETLINYSIGVIR